MSETQEILETPEATEVVDASGLAVETAPSAPDSRDERIAALERELQTERIEHGRVKKLSDENRQLREEVNELKKKLSELTARAPEDYLAAEERDSIDLEQARIVGKMTRGIVEDAMAPLRKENEELRSRIAAQGEADREHSVRAFTNEVNRLAPGLLNAVLSQHKTEWMQWASHPVRKASISLATQNCDAETTAYFLKQFCSENGISGSSQMSESVAEPSPSSGNVRTLDGGDKTMYSYDQFSEAKRQLTERYEAGKISADEYRKGNHKLDAAAREGRVRM